MFALLSKLTRLRDWGYSKIPPLFVAAYCWAMLLPLPPARVMAQTAEWMLFVALYAAYGYCINDYYDAEVDGRAGKANEMGRLGRAWSHALLAFLVCAGAAVVLPYHGGGWSAMALGASYLMATAYSAPPVRLKERGLAGVLAAAAAQRTLPLLVGMTLFGAFQLQDWLLVLLFTAVGIRWILLHQIIDLPNDERALVATFTRASGRASAGYLMKHVIFPAELVFLLAWAWVTLPLIGVVWFLLPTYCIWLLIKFSLWKGIRTIFNWEGYGHHPLSDFYEVFWPLFLGSALVLQKPVYFPLLLLQVFWQWPDLRRRLHSLNLVAKIKLQGT